MAVIDSEEVVVPTPPVAVKVAEEVEPDNVFTLTSGVKVQFNGKLPANVSQRLVISAFSGANINADGRVRENMTSTEQLALADKMFNYNAALILHGLRTKVLDLYGGYPDGNEWFEVMQIDPMVEENHPNINLGNPSPLQKKFLFLFYYGFAEDEDWSLLQNQLLDR